MPAVKKKAKNAILPKSPNCLRGHRGYEAQRCGGAKEIRHEPSIYQDHLPRQGRNLLVF